MDFKTFISESKEKHATLAFVRMNPIHKGHELLLHKVHDISKEHGGDAHVVASHSEGNAKNPIPHKKKLEYIKIKEWEEKFDQEKKLREQEEIRREERLKERELGKIKSVDNENLRLTSTTSLENFEVDKTSEN